MKKFLLGVGFIALIVGCSAVKSKSVADANAPISKNDTIRIANDDLQYEVIIIEPGFDTWLVTNAKPRNFYSLSYLESKNNFFATTYNDRVLQPFRYNSNLYESRIDYDANTHYGYEVNYLLYNYFVYFQQHYRQKL